MQRGISLTTRVVALALLIATLFLLLLGVLLARVKGELAARHADAPRVAVEAAYSFNFNRPSNNITDWRWYDTHHNTIGLQNVLLQTDWNAGPGHLGNEHCGAGCHGGAP